MTALADRIATAKAEFHALHDKPFPTVDDLDAMRRLGNRLYKLRRAMLRAVM